MARKGSACACCCGCLILLPILLLNLIAFAVHNRMKVEQIRITQLFEVAMFQCNDLTAENNGTLPDGSCVRFIADYTPPGQICAQNMFRPYTNTDPISGSYACCDDASVVRQSIEQYRKVRYCRRGANNPNPRKRRDCRTETEWRELGECNNTQCVVQDSSGNFPNMKS